MKWRKVSERNIKKKRTLLKQRRRRREKGFRNGGIDHLSFFGNGFKLLRFAPVSRTKKKKIFFPKPEKGFSRRCEDGDDYRRKYPMKLCIVMKSKKGFPRDLFGNERHLLLFSLSLSLSVHFAKPIHLPLCPRSSGS